MPSGVKARKLTTDDNLQSLETGSNVRLLTEQEIPVDSLSPEDILSEVARIIDRQYVRDDPKQSYENRLWADGKINESFARLGIKPLPQNLQPEANGASVLLLEPQPLTSRLPFLTVDDIKRFVGYDRLLGVLRNTENLAVLKIAHDFAAHLQHDIEAILKKRLWNGNAPEGEMHFSSIKHQNGETYFNAKVKHSTRGIPKEHFAELEQAKEEVRSDRQTKNHIAQAHRLSLDL